MSNDIPSGAVLLKNPAEAQQRPPEPVITQEVTWNACNPGFTFKVNADQTVTAFLNFDVLTGIGALTRYLVPIALDQVESYTEFLIQNRDALLARAEGLDMPEAEPEA
jgi:hypothetical protein